MIDFGAEASGNYGRHRHGWKWVLEQASDLLHSSDANTCLISFIEKKFLFGYEPGDMNNGYAAPPKPWIGFLHVPPYVPSWFSSVQQINRLRSQPQFQSALDNCKAIICLSEYLSCYSSSAIAPGIPHHTILHPSDIDVRLFSCDEFCSQKFINLVQLGFWLRRLSNIHSLRVNTEIYRKWIVGVNQGYQRDVLRNCLLYEGVAHDPDVFATGGFLPDHAYDTLLSRSLVVIDFYDTSANNAIIECISRGTPMLVPRHPAIVEYLGSDYPLYMSGLREIEEFLESPALVYNMASKANEYLLKLSASNLLSIRVFIEAVSSIALNSRLPCTL